METLRIVMPATPIANQILQEVTEDCDYINKQILTPIRNLKCIKTKKSILLQMAADPSLMPSKVNEGLEPRTIRHPEFMRHTGMAICFDKMAFEAWYEKTEEGAAHYEAVARMHDAEEKNIKHEILWQR